MVARSTVDLIRDVLEDVFSGIMGFGMRTLGLVIVFALGSGGLVAALGISATAAQQVRDRLTAAALDQVVARPRLTGDEDGEQAPALPADAVERARSIDGVVASGQTWAVPGSVGPLGRSRTDTVDVGRIFIMGITPGVLDVYETRLAPSYAGGLLGEPSTPRVAVLGSGAARAFGIAGAIPGARIHVGQISLEVVGIITDTGAATGLDRAILVPAQIALDLNDHPDQALLVRTTPGRAFAVSQVLAQVVRPGQPASVDVDPVPDLRVLRRGISTDLDSSAALLAAVMLLLASITTANVMTMSVNDRTPEIALRRAVGTSKRRIAMTFLLEGAAVGLAGGAAGAGSGIVTVLVASWRQGWQPILPGWLAFTGIGAGLLIGMLSAARAALRASRIQPALALRS